MPREVDDKVAVTILIPGPLRTFSGGLRHMEIHSAPKTLRDAMEELYKACPGIRDRLVNEEGHLREHINIFVGQENVRYTGDFATQLTADAEIRFCRQ